MYGEYLENLLSGKNSLNESKSCVFFIKSKYISWGLKMIIAYMITTWLGAIVLALTSRERLGAAGKFNTNPVAMKWFLVVGGIILTVLTVSFLIVAYKQRRQRSKLACNRVMKHGGK